MEVLTQLAAQSLEAMTAIHKVGLLDPLRSGVNTADFLTRFNVIEILADVRKIVSVLHLPPSSIYIHVAMTNLICLFFVSLVYQPQDANIWTNQEF